MKPSLIKRYGIAVLCVATALAVRLLGWSELRAEAPFLVFIAAQVIASWFGGLGPGLLAALLSTLLIDYYLLPPYRELAIPEGMFALHLAFFFAICVQISWLMQNLHNAQNRSEAAEKEGRQRALEAEEGKRIFETLMESLPIGVVIPDAPDGRVRRISKSFCELTGRTRQAVEGGLLGPDLAEWRLVYRADGVTPAAPEDLPLLRALHQGQAITGEEWIVRRPDGVVIPLLCDALPVRDQTGRIVQGISTYHNITERRRSEEALQQAHGAEDHGRGDDLDRDRAPRMSPAAAARLMHGKSIAAGLAGGNWSIRISERPCDHFCRDLPWVESSCRPQPLPAGAAAIRRLIRNASCFSGGRAFCICASGAGGSAARRIRYLHVRLRA